MLPWSLLPERAHSIIVAEPPVTSAFTPERISSLGSVHWR